VAAAVKNCARERGDDGSRGMNAKKGAPRCELSLHRDCSCIEKRAILFTSLLRKYFSAKPSWTLFTNYSLHGFLLEKKRIQYKLCDCSGVHTTIVIVWQYVMYP